MGFGGGVAEVTWDIPWYKGMRHGTGIVVISDYTQ